MGDLLLIDVEDRLRRIAETLHLSPMEARELRLMCAGFTGPESAQAQDLAKQTVRCRRKHVIKKLGATSSLDAVATALGTRQLAEVPNAFGEQS